MKRYLLFTYDSYYPGGGWNDFVGSYDTIEAAVEEGKAKRAEFVEVVDIETLNVVFLDYFLD